MRDENSKLIDITNSGANDGILVGQNSGSIINYGLSPLEASELAISLFQENLPKMEQKAITIINERLTEFCNELFVKLESINFKHYQSFNDPDIQSVLFESGKSYIRKGNEYLRHILCDLIVRRIENDDKNNLYNIILNEACLVVPKLLQKHLNMLTISFFISCTNESDINNIQSLIDYLKLKVIPFATGCNVSANDINHLVYTGCGFNNSHCQLGMRLVKSYPGIFMVDDCFPGTNNKMKKLYVNDNSTEIIKNNGEKENIRSYLISLMPELECVFKIYNDNELFSLSLTSVGSLLGALNYMILTKDRIDISHFYD